MNQLEKVKALDAYEVKEWKTLKETRSEGIVLRHKKTGAKLFLLSNDDENKVFCIGFRTPPDDDTDCPIFWTTVFSAVREKFPLKDPL